MSEYPEDIMKAADAAAATCFHGTSIKSKKGKAAIAAAILAERERCADIARNAQGSEEAYEAIMAGAA